MTSEELLKTALAYRASGLDVIPDHPTEKFPVGFSNWQNREFSDAELTEYILHHGYGIGIKNIEGLDFDNANGVDIEKVFTEWCQLVEAIQPGLLDKLVIEKTQHGGRHVVWKCNQIEGNQKIASQLISDKEKICFIETRGAGGQFMVAPSPGYEVIKGDWLRLPTITTEERLLLLDCAKTFNFIPSSKVTGTPVPGNNGSARPGDIYNEKGHAESLELLLANGWTVVRETSDVKYLRRPGKDRGISATYGYVAPGVLYNFSSNAAPFENGKAYSPFAIFAILKYGGNFSAAASELAAKYGEKTKKDTSFKIQVPWPAALKEEAFHGVAGEFVKLVSPQSEADPAALLLSFLIAIGSVFGDKPHVKVEAAKHPSRLFGILVGPTAKGRKGTSWGYVQILLSLVDEAVTRRIQSGLCSGEGLIWAVRDPIYKTIFSKKRQSYEQQLEDAGVSDKRLIVYESEFASALRVLGRDGNTLSAVIRNAWDHGDLQSLTKNSQARATGAHISIIGHITQDELLKYLSDNETGNGFANRFLYFCVRRSKCLPFGGNIDHNDLKILAVKLDGVISHSQNINEITWSEEAKKIWENIYENLSEGKPGLYGALVSRSEAYVVRLACTYALLDSSDTIRPEHLSAALAVWKYADDSVKYVFQSKTGDSISDTIYDALTKSAAGLTRTQISKLFNNNMSSCRIAHALEVLQSLNLIKKTIVQTGGKPEELWQLIS